MKSASAKKEVLAGLGYGIIDNLAAKCSLLVEGHHDKEALEVVFKKMTGKSVDQLGIQILLLGGGVMVHFNPRLLLDAFPTFAILDNEPNEAAEASRHSLSETLKEFGHPIFTLERYSIESYWSLEAFKKVFHKLLASKTDEKWGSKDFDYVSQHVAESLILLDNSTVNKKTIKTMNTALAEATKIDEILSTDLGGALLEVLKYLGEPLVYPEGEGL